MTVEEFFNPRYRCIARYPHSKFSVGAIYTNKECCEILNPNNVEGCLSVYDCEKYPAIFRKIDWWEYRDIEDMPEYVKEEGGKIHKVTFFEEYGFSWMKADNGDVETTWAVNNKVMCFFKPATKEEYDNQPQ